jgi:hypothetical protein
LSIDASKEELELALARYKRDLAKRCFVVHPHLIRWIECDPDEWLSNIAAELAHDYSPRTARVIQVPKARSLMRPAAVLEPEDAVVFNVLLGRAFPEITRHLRWSRGSVDTAYPLTDSGADLHWTQLGFLPWQNFRSRSLAQLDSDETEYVVHTDITGFYENIDLQRLDSALREIGVPKEVVSLIQKCLRAWAFPRNDGIPQGYSASDILAKLYLDSVDRKLTTAGLSHVRYVDDIRLFCRTRREAKRSIQLLSSLLYPLGLNLQSAKTVICDKAESRRRIDGVAEIIEGLNRKLARELAESGGGYLRPDEVFAALQNHDGPTPEVLERAFVEHFDEPSGPSFDSTLYHYLLARLGNVHSRQAVTYSLGVLRTRPEETEKILEYLSHVDLQSAELDEITSFVESDDAIYDYQLYQIVKWFYERQINDVRMLAFCRDCANDRNRDPSLRSFTFAYLGEFGSPTELTYCEETYAAAQTELERADRVAAVSRMERGRRNSFYARVGGHGKLVLRAVVVAKETSPLRPCIDLDPRL